MGGKVAIKVEQRDAKQSRLAYEVCAYRCLTSGAGISSIY